MQRIGVRVDRYKILNIHRIGIEAPPSYVFEELLNWSGDSTCWPNHIARVVRIEDGLEKIQIKLFGRVRASSDSDQVQISGLPLFNLTARTIHRRPDPADVDNARYLLYDSSGGYPIGVFSMYVRSPIAIEGEAEHSQLFILVGFDFYGKENWSARNPLNGIWESIHDRVSANILNRFKQLCEWRFEKMQAG